MIVPKIERIAGLILFAGLTMKYMGASGYAQLLGISLTTLGITFYLNAFLIKGNGLLEIIFIKLGHIAASVSLVGLMFFYLALPGYDMMLLIGLVTLGLAILATVYNLFQSESPLSKQLLIRYSIVFILGVSNYF